MVIKTIVTILAVTWTMGSVIYVDELRNTKSVIIAILLSTIVIYSFISNI